MKYFIELIHVMQKTRTKSLKTEMKHIHLKKKHFHVEKSTYGLERVNMEIVYFGTGFVDLKKIKRTTTNPFFSI